MTYNRMYSGKAAKAWAEANIVCHWIYDDWDPDLYYEALLFLLKDRSPA